MRLSPASLAAAASQVDKPQGELPQLHHASALRNRVPILKALLKLLPNEELIGDACEVGAGTGAGVAGVATGAGVAGVATGAGVGSFGATTGDGVGSLLTTKGQFMPSFDLTSSPGPLYFVTRGTGVAASQKV
mgnify:CR=1 FL=1